MIFFRFSKKYLLHKKPNSKPLKPLYGKIASALIEQFSSLLKVLLLSLETFIQFSTIYRFFVFEWLRIEKRDVYTSFYYPLSISFNFSSGKSNSSNNLSSNSLLLSNCSSTFSFFNSTNISATSFSVTFISSNL